MSYGICIGCKKAIEGADMGWLQTGDFEDKDGTLAMRWPICRDCFEYALDRLTDRREKRNVREAWTRMADCLERIEKGLCELDKRLGSMEDGIDSVREVAGNILSNDRGTYNP